MKITLRKDLPKRIFIAFFLIYASIYGSLSVFIDSIVVRALKDFLLALIVVTSVVALFSKSYYTTNIQNKIFVVLSLFTLIGILSSLNHMTLALLIYGFKITILPMFGILVGTSLKKKNINISKVIHLVFFLSIIIWLIQRYLGVDFLVSLGFNYGTDVTHYINGMPRLPSIAGSPDSYAFLLAITGILSEFHLKKSSKIKLSHLVKCLTFIFLLLGTIRSPLLLWLVFQIFYYLGKYKLSKGKIVNLYISITCFVLTILPFIFIKFISGSSIADTRSFKARLSRWGEHIPNINETEGLIGFGIGMIGSASLRAHELGFQTLDFASDNQFIAIYGQMGLLGVICFALLIFILLFALKKRIKLVETENKQLVVVAYCLLLATLVSSMFTNNLEVYPFNIFLWIFVGMQLVDYNSKKIAIKK